MPTAFVCNNDHTAYILTRELKASGYRVPEDVSVTGFDDVFYAEISEPPITTVYVNRKFMAEQAISMMERRLQKPDCTPRVVTSDCMIVYRDSVAALVEEKVNRA